VDGGRAGTGLDGTRDAMRVDGGRAGTGRDGTEQG